MNNTLYPIEERYNNELILAGLDALQMGELIGCSARILEVRNGVAAIPTYALKNAHIGRLILPPSLSMIGREAFKNSVIKEILVRKEGATKYHKDHDNIRTILAGAFRNCRGIRVFEPQHIQYVGEEAFQGSSLKVEDIRLDNEIPDQSVFVQPVYHQMPI